MALRGPLETVEDARRRAKRRLPRPVYMALWAGSQAGQTLKENVEAFSLIYMKTHVGDAPKDPDLSTRVFGQTLSMPLLISPVGAQGICPNAEVSVARAAAAAGTAMGLSSFASQPIEAVAAANRQTLFQLFWAGTRDEIAARVERARRAGAIGLIATLDWSFPEGRDWGSPYIPQHIDISAVARYAPEAITHPFWLLDFVRNEGIPTLEVPNMSNEERPNPGFFEAYGAWMNTPPPTWDDIAWLREQWDGPLMVKGILHPDDARRARDLGADALSVSNHGGNDMDGVVPSIAALPAVVDAVGNQIDVLQDGGIRRGSDVVKALALGAKAVMIGRAYLWALAARGETGVREILEVFRAGIKQTLIAIGVESVQAVKSEHIILRERFYDFYGRTPHGPHGLPRTLAGDDH
jgi:heme/flavin dehydrogenase (mycofactocin system)